MLAALHRLSSMTSAIFSPLVPLLAMFTQRIIMSPLPMLCHAVKNEKPCLAVISVLPPFTML